ncbi:MAG: response regulator, partial [Cytophagaceae bacterium]
MELRRSLSTGPQRPARSTSNSSSHSPGRLPIRTAGLSTGTGLKVFSLIYMHAYQGGPLMCRRVLLIEDDEILRFLIADALSHVDVDVLECTTADAGLMVLENAPSNSIAFVFTDIRTPGVLNGFELAKIVWEKWPDLPVILTSGHRSVQEHELPAHS